jgi:hypothetical protein
MDADLRVPFSALSSSPALVSRRMRASTQTRSRGNSTTLTSAALPHQRRSSLQIHDIIHPHQSDSPNCLCTACHLRTAIFPRRQDGRIVLPILWHSLSNSAAEISRGAAQLPEMESHVPNVVETTRDDACEFFLLSHILVGVEIWIDAPHIWGRRSEGSSIRSGQIESHTDRGEGSSRGVPRLSGSFLCHFCHQN